VSSICVKKEKKRKYFGPRPYAVEIKNRRSLWPGLGQGGLNTLRYP